MNKEQFARCPFCGKSETLTIGKASDAFSEPDECGDPSPYMHTETYAVVCDASKPDGPGGCGASGGYKLTEDEAIAAWNRRAEAVASQPPAQAEPAPAPVGEYPALPAWAWRDDFGGLVPSEIRTALRAYLDADRAQRPAREVRLLNGGEFEMLAVECFGLSTSAYVKTTLRKFCEVNGLTIKEQS